MLMRSCSIESRWRMVTVWSSRVWESTVTQNGVPTSFEQVTVTAGAKHAIYMALQAIVGSAGGLAANRLAREADLTRSTADRARAAYADALAELLVAFANSDGGTILIGLGEDGATPAAAKTVLRTMDGVNWQAAPEPKAPRPRKPRA